MEIITNNVARFTIDGFALTQKERKEFDYIDWSKIDAGEGSATFFCYKGQLYDLSQFMRTGSVELSAWDGVAAETYFSGILVKLTGESVIVARYFS